MKKFNKITSMVLSAITATALCAGSAMAAELPDEALYGTNAVSSGTDTADTSDWAHELEWLKSINLDKTDDEWELIERVWNPEANGLVLVGETERVENGYLIVDSIYKDSIVPYVSGGDTYYASSYIYINGQMIATMSLSALFRYDNDRFEKNVHVDRNSIKRSWTKVLAGDYPQEITSTSWCDITVDNEVYNFKRYSQVEYHLDLKLGLRDSQEYVIMIAVDENGEQFRGDGTVIQ